MESFTGDFKKIRMKEKNKKKMDEGTHLEGSDKSRWPAQVSGECRTCRDTTEGVEGLRRSGETGAELEE